jgi:hypothetical protein
MKLLLVTIFTNRYYLMIVLADTNYAVAGLNSNTACTFTVKTAGMGVYQSDS